VILQYFSHNTGTAHSENSIGKLILLIGISVLVIFIVIKIASKLNIDE